MENNTKIKCYTNFDGINNLNEIGLELLDFSLWKKGLYFYFYKFRNNNPVPQYLIDLTKTDNFYLVLDDTEEGYAYYSFSQVHNFVQSHNLHNKVIYATGHDCVETVYEYWLEKKNLQPMMVAMIIFSLPL